MPNGNQHKQDIDSGSGNISALLSLARLLARQAATEVNKTSKPLQSPSSLNLTDEDNTDVTPKEEHP